MPDLQQRVDETAFAMMHLAPADRERCFCEAFEYACSRRPELEGVPPEISVFLAAVFKRIAEMEQQGGTA